MPLVIILGLLGPIIFAAGHALRRRFEEAAPLVLLGLFVLLYLLGWVGWLAAGRWLLYAVWLAAVGYLAWALVVKKGLEREFITLGLVLFVLCGALLWWLCRGRRYANWDEYSHWGRALKGVFTQNVLPAVASLKDEFKEYPPGLAPLQAVLMKAGFLGFREDVAIFVQGLFSAGLLLYPLRLFGWKRPFSALGSGLLLFLAPAMVFWNYYTETTVDGLLGVLFGFVLLVECLGENDWYQRLLQCLACAALPLVKASGLLLAVLACAVVLVGRFAGRPAGKKGFGRRQLWRFAPLGAALLAAGSWQLFMAIHAVPRRWSAGSFSPGALWQLITQGQPAWRAETVRAYFANIFTDLNYGWPGGFLPYMGFFAVFILCWWLLGRVQKNKALGAMFWAMLGGGALYVLLMLASYLFIFSEYEAVRLASLSRYLNTWLAAMVVFMLGWLARVLAAAESKKAALPLAAAAVLWLALGNPAQVLGGFANAPRLAAQTANVQRKYTQAAQAIQQVDQSPNPRVYVVAIDDLGATLLRLDYELAPQYLPDQFSSIGPHYAEDDLLSRRLTREEWAGMLAEGYDYVYLFEVKESFTEEFGPLFQNAADITDGSLLRVVQAEDGLSLQRLEG